MSPFVYTHNILEPIIQRGVSIREMFVLKTYVGFREVFLYLRTREPIHNITTFDIHDQRGVRKEKL